MKFSICNLGCKVNAFEAESIAKQMEDKGWDRVSFDEPADATFIFTCAVTNMAAQKSRKMMHRARRQAPDCIVSMVGCYSQVEEGELDDADIILGTKEKREAVRYLEEYLKNPEKIRVVSKLDSVEFDNLETSQFENRTRAYLKVQDGCNQFCSYCVIPYARGRERSMAPDRVIAEAQKLAENYPEIVLTGIHTGRYGKEYGVTLTELMQRVLDEVPNLQRLRISSIEETEIDDAFIALVKKEPRIARHLHIPLQAGSDGVLKNMHRPYTTQQYYEKLEKIRKEIPGIAISCDLIVGFPQESDSEFEATCDFIQKCQFSFLHVFQYSVRKGTVAEKMSGHIDPRVKKARMKRCVALSDAMQAAYEESLVGSVVDVIAERSEEGYTRGYASQYAMVYIKGELPRGLYRVRCTEYTNHHLIGEIVEE